MKNKKTLIKLNQISYSYPDRPPVLDKLDFTFKQGEKVGLMAPNGTGKTTFFHIMMGLIKPGSGSIEIFNQPVEKEKDFVKIRRRIGLLFQDSDDQLFHPTVIEDVAFGPLNLGKTKEEAIEISKKTLEYLGLHDFENRITFKLSGGEKRLVALATILAMEPEILLLDEPSAGLDEKTKEHITGIFKDLAISYIVVSHELDFLSEITDSIHTLDQGKIISDAEMHIHQHYHAHPYGGRPHKHKDK